MDSERLLGKLEKFMDVAEADLKEIKSAVLELQNFKWRVAGGAAVLSLILVVLVEVIHLFK